MRGLALAGALLAAWVLPGAPPGIGVVLVALLVAAAAVSASTVSRDLVGFGAAALALASFAAILDAGWVVAVDLAAAWVFATVAVAGPRLRGLLAPVSSLPRAAPELVPPSASRAAPAVRGIAIGTLVTIPFATLFLTADAAFAAIADSTPRPQLDALPARTVVFALVLLAAVGLATARPARPVSMSVRSLTAVEWALPLGALVALFAAFVSVQVTVLFGGHDHVLETTGLTYAEYARQGFWQLLAASALTLAVVKAATLVARPATSRQRLLLRGLLGALCALTIVVVASAVHRLGLYEDAFGLTRLRLTAEATAFWLAGVFALVLLAGALRRTSSLPRALLAWSAVALIGFSAANPDARIAERNVDRWEKTGRFDTDYAAKLSLDAAPVLDRLPVPLRADALAEAAGRLDDPEPWSSANLSRWRARRVLGR